MSTGSTLRGRRSISRWVAQTVLGQRFVALALTLWFALWLAMPAMLVRFDSSIGQWFVESDPGVAAYEEFLDTFATDQLIVVGVFADDVFDPLVLATIEELTDEIEAVEAVRDVRTMLNTTVLQVDDGRIEIGPLGDRGIPSTNRFRDEVLEQPLLVQNLVAPDGTATAMLVDADTAGGSMDNQVALVSSIREIVESRRVAEIDIRVVGSPVLEDAFLRYSLRDFFRVIPLALMVALGFCVVIFRHPALSAAPVLLVAGTGISVVGVMGLAGLDANMLSAPLVAIVAVAGIANPVHLVSDYKRRLADGEARRAALENAVTRVLLPCFVTTATTLAGFLSLLVSDLSPVREFSALAATGLVIAFAGTFTFVPAFLSLLPAPSPASLARAKGGLTERALGAVSRPSRRRAVVIVGAGLALMGWSAAESSSIRVSADFTSYLADDDPVIQDIELVDRALNGSTTLEFFVHAPDRGLLDPEVLQRLHDLQTDLEGRPGIASTFSVASIVADAQRSLAGPDAPPIPESPETIGLIYDQISEHPIFGDFVVDDLSTGRLNARINFSDAQILQSQIPDFAQLLAESYDDDQLQVEMTGVVMLLGQMDAYLNASLWESFLVAFVAVSVILTLLFRSLLFGALALIPNVAPILFGLGIMRLFDLPMDTGTVMVAAVAMGLVVDDTVHLLHAVQHELRDGATVPDAVAHAVVLVGRPLAVTSCILASGFGVLAVSTFMPTVRFGTVSAFIAVFALVSDLILLPALILLARPLIDRGASSLSGRSDPPDTGESDADPDLLVGLRALSIPSSARSAR